MRKGHTITGLNVIGRDGAELGKVIDLIFDHEADQCVGLLLREKELFGIISPQIVPWDDIVSIGKDAVMVKGADSVIQPSHHPHIQHVMARDTHLSGSVIYSEDGTNLGTFGDVYLDEVTGRVQGYEVSGGFVADTMSGKRYMSVPIDRTIGDHVVIVPNDAAQAIHDQAENDPGGVRGALSTAGEKVAGAYDSAKAKVGESYDATKATLIEKVDSLDEASTEKQKEYLIGKVAERTVYLPAPTLPDGTSALDHGPLLIAAGDTIAWSHADLAGIAGILPALIDAAGGSEGMAASHIVASQPAETAVPSQEPGGDLQLSLEKSAIGKPAGIEVLAENGSTLVAPGMLITPEVMAAAKAQGKEKQVIAAAGVGHASQSAQDLASDVREEAGGLWDAIKEKTAELTGAAHDKKDELDATAEKHRIEGALGRPVTRVILAQDDSIILNTGDLITHKAIELARENEALDMLLDSVYVDEPEITPEMLKVQGIGSAALPSQQATNGD